ncbi:MAG TPA: SUMF1/EgtB/PvdO family nonheme iron enzyme [Candidatus Polarisedimenticolaceae bacterium]|nr:SUMF1/EgtB/PvdO family nonheme iron enzyme [Candidatus Polarisedimenticolaceae bacterium]
MRAAAAALTTLALAGCRAPGAPRTDAAGIGQVWVPAGSFTMGTTEGEIALLRAEKPPDWVARAVGREAPAHHVSLSHGFWIDEREVTNAAFDRFVKDGGYGRRDLWSADGLAWLAHQDRAALPATCLGTEPEMPRRCVTWFEAEAYARWRGGRLPTEAEWEFAARGPASSVYPWGMAFDASRCNVEDSPGPTPAGKFPSGRSWVGASDMAGNAMEWVSDWLAPYAVDDVTDPAGPSTGKVKVEKGGWWGANRYVARAAYRHFEDPPSYGDKHIGFRVVTDER